MFSIFIKSQLNHMIYCLRINIFIFYKENNKKLMNCEIPRSIDHPPQRWLIEWIKIKPEKIFALNKLKLWPLKHLYVRERKRERWKFKSQWTIVYRLSSISMCLTTRTNKSSFSHAYTYDLKFKHIHSSKYVISK
jgi:hypothetical protein